MVEDTKENEIKDHQKYFLFFQCCFWIYQIIVISLGLTIMARLIMVYNNTQNVLKSDLYAHAQETVVLWNQGYIIDIRVQKTNNCPEGYTPLINYQWPGTIDGCYCQNTANNYTFQFVLIGKCSSQLISLGCQGVQAMKAQTLNMWKGSQLICYKRAESMTFYNSILSQAPSGGNSSNMRVCSSNQPYQVYTFPGVSCPITAVSNASLGGSQTSMTLDSINNYNINFNSQTGYPIADFKLTEYQFCSFFNQTNISPNKQGTYILQMQTLSQPCSSIDPRMVNIDSLDQQDFYTNNTRVYQLITSLPAYPQPSIDYKYILGYIPYPTWTFQCRNSSAYNLQIATSNILFKDSLSTVKLTIQISIPCILIFIILLRIFFIGRHIIDLKNKTSYNAIMLSDDQIAQQIPNISIKKSFKKQTIIFIIEILLLGAIFGSIIYSINNLTKDSIWIKQILQYQCTDSYLSIIFLYYEGIIDDGSNILVQTTFIWVVLLCIHIIYYVLRVKIGDLNIKQQQVVEEIPSESQQPVQILDKQGKLQGISMQDSSEIILNLNKQNRQQLKVYDVDLIGGDLAGETKDNFYGSLQRQASINVVKKKKKKKVGLNKKKKNLFKQDQL